MVILNLSESLAKPLVMAKTEHGIFVKFKKPSKPFCKTEQKFLRPAQRYGNFKLIRITCQAACHGKTEHGIFVKFKKPSKTASLPVSKNRAKLLLSLIAGVTISGTPCPRHITVPFGAEAPSGHVARA